LRIKRNEKCHEKELKFVWETKLFTRTPILLSYLFSFHRWAKIQNVPYIPDFDIVQRELKKELEAKIQQERLGHFECFQDAQHGVLRVFYKWTVCVYVCVYVCIYVCMCPVPHFEAFDWSTVHEGYLTWPEFSKPVLQYRLGSV
jgi:hypothetical protein